MIGKCHQCGSQSRWYSGPEVLEISDERDRMQARLLEAELRAWQEGYAAGVAAGRQEADLAREADWKVVSARLQRIFDQPTNAELKNRRRG